MPVEELDPEQLCASCDPSRFDFETTEELDDYEETPGQTRAMKALEFGVGMNHEGYNLFALGAEGTGKRQTVERFLKKAAGDRDCPSDWCYVNNFEERHEPRCLELPAGRGSELKHDMELLSEDLLSSLEAAFESEEYKTRRQAIEEEFGEKQEEQFKELNQQAEEAGFAIMRTPLGVVFAPIKDGEPLPPDEFDELPEEEQKELEEKSKELEEKFRDVTQELPGWERERSKKLRELNEEMTKLAISRLLEELREKYSDLDPVLEFFDAIEKDVIEHAGELIRVMRQSSDGGGLAALLSGGSMDGEDDDSPPSRAGLPKFGRYHVNLLIDNAEAEEAPVIFEPNPSHQNLIGRVEHRSRMGTLTTDFRLIRPGALHRANGGYLILQARDLLMAPFAYETLKRTLKSHEIRVESLERALSVATTVSLEPEPIPLDVKIVLIGEPRLYYLLSALDPEFDELVKVQVDFADEMDRTDETELRLARVIATIARKNELKPFHRDAVARVLEQCSREVSDSEKLSTRIEGVVDLLREADYCAGDKEVVEGEDVQEALDARVFRSDRIRERYQEAILRDTILIDTEGTATGQVNGLSVLQLGTFAFGRPTRITARIRFGRGNVIDIEREVELGGPIHSKGVLILQSLLGARYAPDEPLAIQASLVFEQSYGGVDGDSASSTELYALLSAIADVPLRQDLAVTGSVNQHGRVQAIGGVNEKIEGFFDLCRERGLTGDQGVLIPASNAKHLMVRHDVRSAVKEGTFHIYPIQTIDEGIELLAGIEAGEPDEDGNYPESTLNGRVQKRLRTLADKLSKFGKTLEEKDAS